ncbi:MAG: trypsin-like serine protease [Anaerolineae bacterium]|nr:trypsin-like serine protease [Anaerolineae bacterium]
MRKLNVYLWILFTVGFMMIVIPNTWAQEPTAALPGEPTPTPSPDDGPIKPQIVGGQVADPGEYPWQVAIIDASSTNPYNGQFCGGSLIDAEWVLTASHCVVSGGSVTSPGSINVVVGINNLTDGPTSGSKGQRLAVVQVIPHPNFNETTLDKDVALLHLAAPATLNTTVKTIGVVGPGDSALFEAGDTATITGWGTTSEGGSGSNALREVSVPIVSNATCNSSSSYGGQITSNMLCAGLAAGGKDACQGDSGGPLIVPNGSGGWLQAGIVSWGTGCARPDLYGVYTRVSQFKSWINSYTNTGASATAVYLPLLIRTTTNTIGCTPTTPSESDDINDASIICSGQKVSGQVNESSDYDDVYKISVEAGQRIKITMNGSGGNADLYLFPPDASSVYDSYFDYSGNTGNDESIDVTVSTGGFWYVDVYAVSGTTNYNVTVTVTTP